jgi:hypothetical protein
MIRLKGTSRGFALIITLVMVGLCTTLIVAVHMVSTAEYKSGATELDRMRSRTLADSAVAMALSQLATGTTQTFSNGTPKPWTSQPGALRVHDMSGKLESIYKLYSAADMVVEDENALTLDLASEWQSQPDTFVDLNVPSFTNTDGLQFPIVDPRNMSLDPAHNVEGFSYGDFPGGRGPAANPDDQRLPMPVRWIYVLQDGTLAVVGPRGTLVGAANASISEHNPVVGRVAFWVDDETSKINVNTASEGAFWDTPKADNFQERYLATHQPSRLEYQRQPGHPAGVCLSSVLLPNYRHYPSGFIAETPHMLPMSLADAQALWGLGRLAVASDVMLPSGASAVGTSYGGVQPTDWNELWPTQPSETVLRQPYATVHEMIFGRQPPHSQTQPLSQRRRSSFFHQHPSRIQRLARSGFFLTTDSAAPDITLFGTPKIALWPVHAQALLNMNNNQPDALRRDTPYDRKILLASMLKGRPWVVQRSEPGNGVKDFQSHANGANEDLFDHLQRLTDRAVPGFYAVGGGPSTFAEKYEADRDSIVLQMMDHIRSTNFADGHLSASNQFSILCPGVEHHGFGQVSPLQNVVSKNDDAATIQAHGRFLTISEVAIIIVCRAEVDANGKIQGTPSTVNRAQLTSPGDREVEVGVLVEAYVPGMGWADYRPWASVSLVGGAPGSIPDTGPTAPLPPLKLNGTQLVLHTGGAVMESADAPPSQWNVAGGQVGLRSLTEGMLMFRPVVVKGGTQEAPPPLHFEGAADASQQLRLAVYDSPSGAGAGRFGKDDLVQVIPLMLPDILPTEAVRLPGLPRDRKDFPLSNRWKESTRKGAPVISPQDVVQSLAPIHGDYRLLGSQRWVDSRRGKDAAQATPIFVPHLAWGKRPQAHSLRDDTLPIQPDSIGYVSGLHYAVSKSSDLPSSLAAKLSGSDDSILLRNEGRWISGSYNKQMDLIRLDGGRRGPILPYETGDFDNGIGSFPDGPGTNRPDDGHWAAAREGKDPYFDAIPVRAAVPPVSLATFSAQRLLPSPVKFGSLPTGSRSHVPWQTLLFRPAPEHYGATNPPDHLLLDLFYSPVLEPQILSHKFETKGRINLNHKLIPFTHIHRATALHAALKAETIMAIPDTAAATYKTGSQPDQRFRHYIDIPSTLKLIDQSVFKRGRVFLTPSQICEHYLVPENLVPTGIEPTNEIVEDFWRRHRLTGDNSKEQPYAHLYSRLTTRSNTYRVHFVAQALKKARSARPDTFDSSKEEVLSTFRGTCLIHRRIDPEHPDLPDYLSPDQDPASPLPPLDQLAAWRVSAIQTN